MLSSSRLRLLLLITSLALAGIFLGRIIYINMASQEAYTLPSGGDFQLKSAQGPVSLSQYPQKAIVVYFGYTYCPDICPTSLMTFSQAMQNLTPEEAARVQGIFISVDPERDHPERLASYVDFFDTRLIGATGSQAQIDQLTRAYGAFYRKVELPDSAMGYAIDHSSNLYIVNSQGDMLGVIPHSHQAQPLVDTLRKVLAQPHLL
ncbi:protein SCO1/2 [Allopseudospirillum japonicum]|uniref:Protein SCO1/2 n=1 Tax=Allopseudospirillum japonicum TaxID=64971 RepID=A0A1H6R6Q0_9GAMM|nr:SCO family protein [Allopseudospirillum japonicum]SEI46852.1 protein SCO1/2 [Allopseudospirillum japonicum]